MDASGTGLLLSLLVRKPRPRFRHLPAQAVGCRHGPGALHDQASNEARCTA